MYDSAADGLKGIQDRASQINLPEVTLPQFMKDMFKGSSGGGGDNTGSGDGSGSSKSKKDRPEGEEAALAALVAATMSAPDPTNDAKNDGKNPPRADGLMHLTRKLIEIRTILLSIDQKDGLKLPSIVVIGSQSSGKSSVLEAIVGQEFLPK